MRQPIKNTSRVPVYPTEGNRRRAAISCVKPLPWRGQRGLGLRLKPSLGQGRLDGCEKVLGTRTNGVLASLRHFLLVLFEKNVSEIDTIILTDELEGPATKFPSIRRDTKLRKFFTMGRQIPGESPR